MDQPILFDPSIDQLNKLVEATRTITAEDLSDDTQLAKVKETRLQLRDARIAIEKKGKSMREDALKYQKDVIAREKELIGIIEPEEARLKSLEEEAIAIKTRAARMGLLPMRREQLSFVEEVFSDESILDMDNDEFITYLNTKKAEKLDRDMAELKAREAAIADKERLAQVAEAARVAEQNRLEALQRADAAALEKKNAYEKQQRELEVQKIIDDAKEKAAQIAREHQDKEDKRIAQEIATKREIEVREQQAKDEAAKREADHRYQAWLVSIDYKEGDRHLWYFETKGNVTNAYKLTSIFTK